ncbi:MAG: polyphosphate kinase 2 family protein, partial [Thaumarchaeota archaeon]|nr:polyphosphate kinase 2 family protein [Nitrososphaerota archaeon]
MQNLSSFRIQEGQKVILANLDPNDTSFADEKKGESKDDTKKLISNLDRLQEILYAENKHKVLIVLQGMDTSGKDGVIRRIFEGVNPA